jgi:hypothetical protein
MAWSKRQSAGCQAGIVPRAASHLGDLHSEMTPTDAGKIEPEWGTLGSVDSTHSRLESNSWQFSHRQAWIGFDQNSTSRWPLQIKDLLAKLGCA